MIDPKTLVAAALSLAGGAGTSIGYMYAQFTPLREHNQLVAKSDRSYILELVDRASSEPEDRRASTCKLLYQAIAELCAAAKDDALCVDRKDWIERAGC